MRSSVSNYVTMHSYATVTFLSPACSQILRNFLEPLILIIGVSQVVNTLSKVTEK